MGKIEPTPTKIRKRSSLFVSILAYEELVPEGLTVNKSTTEDFVGEKPSKIVIILEEHDNNRCLNITKFKIKNGTNTPYDFFSIPETYISALWNLFTI